MTGALILGVDTSTFWLNLALVGRDGRPLAEHHEKVKTHATHLVPALEELMRAAGADRSDLAGLGVVVGPGSFTGLRVGLASAEGLCQALGIPAHGMDSLTALAHCSAGEGEGVALLDARRSQVYAARFLRRGGGVTRLGGIRCAPPGQALAEAAAPSWAIGDGVPLVSGWPEECVLDPQVPNLAKPAALFALERMTLGAPGERLEPLYVRPPDVRRGET